MKRFKMINIIIVIAILSAMIFMTFTDRPMDKDSLIVIYISFLILSFQELLSIEDSNKN